MWAVPGCLSELAALAVPDCLSELAALACCHLPRQDCFVLSRRCLLPLPLPVRLLLCAT